MPPTTACRSASTVSKRSSSRAGSCGRARSRARSTFWRSRIFSLPPPRAARPRFAKLDLHEPRMPLVLLARAVALLPWSSLRRAGALIGTLAGSVLRIRRAHVEAAVRRAGFGDVTAVARGMYVSLGTALLEFLWMVG